MKCKRIETTPSGMGKCFFKALGFKDQGIVATKEITDGEKEH